MKGEVVEPVVILGRKLVVRAVRDNSTMNDTISVLDESTGGLLAQIRVPSEQPARFNINGVFFDTALQGDTLRFWPDGGRTMTPSPAEFMKINDLNARRDEFMNQWPPAPTPQQILFRIGPRGSGKTLSILRWLAEEPSRRAALFANQEIVKHARELAVRHGLADRLEWWNLCTIDQLSSLQGHQKPLEVAIDDLDLVLPELLGVRGLTLTRATVTGYFDDEGGDNTWNRSPKDP